MVVRGSVTAEIEIEPMNFVIAKTSGHNLGCHETMIVQSNATISSIKPCNFCADTFKLC